MPYEVGTAMLHSGEGWRIAAEEDGNRLLGMVWMERDAPQEPATESGRG